MKKTLILTLLIYISSISLHSQSIFTVEGSEHFKKFNLENVEIINGLEGKKNLALKEREYKPTPDTDFLIHFNNNSFEDESGNYTVKEHYNNISSVKKMYGSASAYFLKNRGLKFSSNGESMFTKGRVLGDFSIEFWIYPTTIDQDTTLFSWKGVNKVEDQFIKQIIKSYFEDRQAVWYFENLFTPENSAQYAIKLKGKSKLIPNRWSHHLIRYNSNTGMLEYVMNGEPEDIKYTTKSYKEEPMIFPAYIGNFSKSEIFIGERFRGFIDEFRISESFISTPYLESYKETGYFETPVYDISGETINILGISHKSSVDPETAINYYFRTSNRPFLSRDREIPWQECKETLSNVSGRYIQLSGELFSDGKNSKTPVTEKIEVKWSSVKRPPAPAYIEIEPGIEKLTLKWKPVKHYNVIGYTIYIGDKSNNYQEIIDVGNNTTYTIDNLTSKKIYYFSIKSYNKDRQSDFSNETYSRPK